MRLACREPLAEVKSADSCLCDAFHDKLSHTGLSIVAAMAMRRRERDMLRGRRGFMIGTIFCWIGCKEKRNNELFGEMRWESSRGGVATQ